MAKLESNLFDLRGKVRDLVFKKTKFGTTVSSYNSDVYKRIKWSDKQKGARAKFGFMTKLARAFRKANDLGFRLEMTYVSQPCFVKHNYSSVVVNDVGRFEVDYSRLCVSRGTLPLLNNAVVDVVDGVVKFRWNVDSKRGVRGDDRVVAALYFPDYKYEGCVDDGIGEVVVCDSGVKRVDGELSVEVSRSYWGLKVYCYLFVVDKDGRSSDSQFVGSYVGAVVEGAGDAVPNDIVMSDGTVFVGVEQREEEVKGKIRGKFVIYFRDEDELLEEVLEEPVEASDFERSVEGGVSRLSKSEVVMRRFRDLIREVNPGLFAEKYSRGEVLEADTWDDLCALVTRAVMRE